jgi:hypothetical protein
MQACWEDVRTGLDSQLLRCQSRFLAEYGNEYVREIRERVEKLRRDSLGQPPPRESYEVVDESPHRVIAQILRPDRQSPYAQPIPFITSRFLLIKGEAGWRIAGIYHPCVCNSLVSEIQNRAAKRESGKCGFCRGKGTTYSGITKARGFWPFRLPSLQTGPCKFCGGTGKCHYCVGEDMPGWRSALDPYRATVNALPADPPKQAV